MDSDDIKGCSVILGAGALALAAGAALSLIGALPTYFIWNLVIVDLCPKAELQHVTFWQAYGLMLFISMLRGNVTVNKSES